MYALVYECVYLLMDRQMGQSLGTVDEGFRLQLPLSLPLCSNLTLKHAKKSTGTICVCVCVCV